MRDGTAASCSHWVLLSDPCGECERDEDAQQVLRLDATATPGPWQVRYLWRVMAVVRRHARRFGLFFETKPHQDWADAEFCAEARTRAPALAQQVLDLQARLRAMKSAPT